VVSGTVKFFHAEKGYGFIDAKVATNIFVHFSQIEGDGYRHPPARPASSSRSGPGRRATRRAAVRVV